MARKKADPDRLELRYIPLSQARRWDENPKRHDLDALVRSIETHGFGDPAKYDSTLGALVYGNRRTEALERMRQAGKQPPRGIGVTGDGDWAVPVIFGVDAASHAAAVAFAIDHNNLTLLGGDLDLESMLSIWDEELLRNLLADTPDAGELLASLGEVDVAAMLRKLESGGPPPEEEELEEPDEETEPVLRAGDLVTMGEHRLLVGDSTDPGSVERVLAGAEPLLMIFDPPFDVPYSAWSVPESVRVLMVWGRGEERIRWEPQLLESGWGVSEIVFSGGVQGWPAPWFPCTVHNAVHFWRRDGWRIAKQTGFDPAVIRACGCEATVGDRPKSVQAHTGGVLTGYEGMSWGKPVLAMEIAVSFVQATAGVYDPLAGSGSSLIAADRHGRRWLGMENQPKWADLVVRRYLRQGNEKTSTLEREGARSPLILDEESGRLANTEQAT